MNTTLPNNNDEMGPPGQFESWLRRHRAVLLDDPSPPGEHLAEERIAAVLEGRARLSRKERYHLARCTECRDVAAELGAELAVDERTSSWDDRIRAWLQPPVPVLAGALAAVAVGWLVVLPPTAVDSGYRARGADDQTATQASVTLMATAPDGVRRDVPSGAKLGSATASAFGTVIRLVSTRTSPSLGGTVSDCIGIIRRPPRVRLIRFDPMQKP